MPVIPLTVVHNSIDVFAPTMRIRMASPTEPESWAVEALGRRGSGAGPAGKGLPASPCSDPAA